MAQEKTKKGLYGALSKIISGTHHNTPEYRAAVRCRLGLQPEMDVPEKDIEAAMKEAGAMVEKEMKLVADASAAAKPEGGNEGEIKTAQ